MESIKTNQENNINTNFGKLRVDSFHKINELFPDLMTEYQNIETNSLQNYLSKYSIEHAIKINEIKLAKKILADLQRLAIIHDSLNELEFYRIMDLTQSDLNEIAKNYNKIKEIYNFKSIEKLLFSNINLANRMSLIEVQEHLESDYPNIYEYKLALNKLCHESLNLFEEDDDYLDEDDKLPEESDDDIIKFYEFEETRGGDEDKTIINDCKITNGSNKVTCHFAKNFSIGMHVSGKGISEGTFIKNIINSTTIDLNQIVKNDVSGNDKTTLTFYDKIFSYPNCKVINGSNVIELGNNEMHMVVEGCNVSGKGIIEGTYTTEVQDSSVLISQDADSAATGLADSTITFVWTNEHDEGLYHTSVDDDEFLEFYDSRIKEDNPDEDIENGDEDIIDFSEIYLYLSEDEDLDDEDLDDEDLDDEDLDDEDLDDEDLDDEDLDDEDLDDEDLDDEDLDDEEVSEKDAKDAEERELIVDKMNLDELPSQILSDDDYFNKNTREAYRNFMNILSLLTFSYAQFFKDHIAGEEDIEEFDMRGDLDTFEGMIIGESDKNYGDEIIVELKKLIEENPDKFKDSVKFCENAAFLYSQATEKINILIEALIDIASETNSFKVIFRKEADGVDAWGINNRKVYEKFKKEHKKQFPILAGRIENLEKEVQYNNDKVIFWYKKALELNNSFGYDVDSLVYALTLNIQFPNDQIVGKNQITEMFNSVMQNTQIQDILDALLRINKKSDDSDDMAITEKNRENYNIVFDYISDIITEYLDLCKRFYGESEKYISNVCQIGGTLITANDSSNLDKNKAWQKFCESVAKEIIKTKNKEFKIDLKIAMYKLADERAVSCAAFTDYYRKEYDKLHKQIN
jgi:hypothetical protein